MSSTTSLQRTIFRTVVLIVIGWVTIYGSLTASILFSRGMSLARQLVAQRNLAAAYYLKAYFTPLRSTAEFLSSQDIVRNLPRLGLKEREEVLGLYRALEAANPDLYYVYSGYEDGSLVINNYVPPPGFDPRVRPWYTAALGSAPDLSPGIPYQEIKTGEWLVSISKVLLDDEGNRVGVVSIDASMERAAEFLRESITPYTTSYSYVVNPRGIILIHHREELLGKNLSDIIRPPAAFTKTSSPFEYRFEGVEKFAHYTVLPDLGWVVVTVLNKSEVLLPLIHQITMGFLVVALLAATSGWAASRLLTRHVITPLATLQADLERVISGAPGVPLADYPDNEVGQIAKGVEQLTRTELYRKNQALKALNTRLEILSTTDPLTSIFNRRKLQEELTREYHRALRYGSPFSLILIDLDHFKTINDTFGHGKGDEVLIWTAEILRTHLRSTDIVGRWGGEEFLVLCPETRLSEAALIASKLGKEIARTSPLPSCRVTISAGVVSFSPGKSLEDLLKEADEKLYRAKGSGRNTVIV
ncbi:diguanylate cyclase [Spirochaeta thermophila DSM 6578]|uniref:diguanylate cyclase n=1 Tax=Winmispira thermophila (strain ATCC 700085 / DSM 6578 / Z-1203) TaxID=869211 RepID=G0GAR4_WINT7|nr:sensor domain-containing diguanylate cyclase [Spirochaeta thermophila]AEJ61810.1 diguanylate cyclase [Spirochaeta thermophila DSM 6578]